MSAPGVDRGPSFTPLDGGTHQRDARRRSYNRIVVAQDEARRLLRQRRAWGADRYDEVWDGVYRMSPIANNEHQLLAGRLCVSIMQAMGDRPEILVYPGVNITDREDDWTENFRCPDVAVFLPGNPASDRETHWLGGPDFAVEIVSKGDRSRKKFGFYHKVGVRELLFVNRRPWRLELYSRGDEGFVLGGKSTPAEPALLASTTLPVTFRLLPAEPRPRIEIAAGDGRAWLA